jgi:hypothetical protein
VCSHSHRANSNSASATLVLYHGLV